MWREQTEMMGVLTGERLRVSAATRQREASYANLDDDYAIIGEWSRTPAVLDLGCGDGELLEWLAEPTKGLKLAESKSVGSKRPKGRRARRLGLPGRHRRGAGGLPRQGVRLRHPQPDSAGDSSSAQVLTEMMRVGRRAIVAFPNFGHWRVRIAHLFSGRAPATTLFPLRVVRVAEHPLPDSHRLRRDDRPPEMAYREAPLRIAKARRRNDAQPLRGGRRLSAHSPLTAMLNTVVFTTPAR